MERLFSKPPCDRCKILKGNKFDQEDCKECLPDALPENEDAIKIYSLVHNQFIMGPRGPISLNHEPIHRAMELYEVEDKQGCFEKILKLSYYFMEKQNH